ncbi:uncharacterized protein LOC131624518 [Vicia villosa]|uniref:uncharacterized protein LOC131624518 n=1 Tax=Vicia villosa TaxID=3911 RepID=UPI00273BA486|nr:uncharacterized protein LOC131624518 [Vicia villosa]
MVDFRVFVEDMGLVDVSCVGGKYTWFKDNGKAMSRLDRFLCSRKMIEEWGVVDQIIEKRDISDHTPIRLRLGVVDWGPKPFRFNNVWLKASLGVWNKEVFGWLDLKLKEEVDSLNVLDNSLMENLGDHVEELVNSRREVSKELWHYLNLKESMLRLKSRQLWLKEGDKNSRLFHNSIKDKQRKNSISSLERRNGRVQGVANIKKEVHIYFLEFFKEEDNERPLPDLLDINRLKEDEALWLERPFSEEEIREVAWACDGNKSPGRMDLLWIFSKVIGRWLKRTLEDSFWTSITNLGLRRLVSLLSLPLSQK